MVRSLHISSMNHSREGQPPQNDKLADETKLKILITETTVSWFNASQEALNEKLQWPVDVQNGTSGRVALVLAHCMHRAPISIAISPTRESIPTVGLWLLFSLDT